MDVTVSDTEVWLIVTDDGAGIIGDPHESGLRNARRRAADLGGRLELSANEPSGTVLIWRVPLA